MLSPDLGTLEALSFSECALLCAGSSACQFWAFDGLGKCELTSTEPVVKQSLSSAHSGSRICGRLGSLSQGKIHLFPKKNYCLGCMLMPHAKNNATPIETSYGSQFSCAALSKSFGSKYWTLLPDTTCHLYNELSPKPSNDKTVTGSQACADFYDQQLLTFQQSSGRKKRSTIPTTVQPPNIDVFLNPMRHREKDFVEAYMTNITRELFNPPLPQSSYPHLFRLLRHTNLPCMPSVEDQGHMILRYMQATCLKSETIGYCYFRCMWSGQKVDCAKIFTPVPTDYGMCCAFNPRTILR